jgi:hypothetical protein
MTNPHPDQSPTASSRRWLAGGTPIWLVVSLVLTACFEVAAWFNAQWWLGFVLMMMMTVMLAAELLEQRSKWWFGFVGILTIAVMFAAGMLTIAVILAAILAAGWLGQRWGWTQAVIQQARRTGLVLLIVVTLSVQAITGREWNGPEVGLLAWGLIVVALGVRRIIWARRQTGDSGTLT